MNEGGRVTGAAFSRKVGALSLLSKLDMASFHYLRMRGWAWKVVAVLTGATCLAQFRPRAEPTGAGSGHYIRIEGGQVVNEDELRTARETASHSTGTPEWANAPEFEKDVFTFARVIFQSDRGGGFGGRFGRYLGWWVDYPDADLNLSFRLQQVTTIRTDPDARVIRLTDPDVPRYPLLYMEHAGYMRLTEEEVAALRRYLNSGGALLVNDFWGEQEWDGFAGQIARVLPNGKWTELSIDHPIFHCVYDLEGPMHKLRVPTMQFWNEDGDPNDPNSPLQTVYRGEGWEQMHVQAMLDERGHLQIVAIHNSDVSDGWEREQENQTYFNRFSEKTAYPLGINIVVYLMTH